MFIDPTKANGHQVTFLRTDPRHLDINGLGTPLETGAKQDFNSMLSEALHGVNNDQIKMSDLAQKLVTDPDKVDAHDVTIASAQAQMSLGIAKAVIDRAVTAYKEIINIR